MKKLFFSLMAVAAVANANAVDFGVTAGIGAATISNDDVDATVAWNLGAKANFGLSSNLFAEASALFQHQGFKYTAKTLLHNKEYKYNLYYLNFPVNIGYNFNVGNGFSIAPKAGFLLGFGLFGNESDLDCNPFSEREDNSKIQIGSWSSDSALEDFSRFDFGFNAGVNLNYRKFQLGLQYTWGISSFSDDIDDANNRVFTANFAYFF